MRALAVSCAAALGGMLRHLSEALTFLYPSAEYHRDTRADRAGTAINLEGASPMEKGNNKATAQIVCISTRIRTGLLVKLQDDHPVNKMDS